MSGESYNYLYAKQAREIISESEHEEMILFIAQQRLINYPKLSARINSLGEQLRSTKEQIELLENKLQESLDNVQHILKTVEWIDSLDSSEQELIDLENKS